jgi:uncharacterized protein (DUF488 family)
MSTNGEAVDTECVVAEQVESMTQPDTGPIVRETPQGLYSIGHSNVALEALLSLLQRYHIDVVADVRTSPRSRYVPHFDAQPLREALAQSAIKYVPLGKQLGGRPDDDEFYDEQDHVLYDRLAATQEFQVGIERILRGAKDYRVALLCSEEDPSKCHRHLLIGRVLRDRGITLLHIRGDGRIQTEDDLAAAEANNHPQPTLFESRSGERQWRSIQSVSRRRTPLNSSAH